MRAVVIPEPGRLEVREVPDPAPEKGEILVKLEACGICTLEQRIFKGSMKVPLPVIPGHEAAGVVVARGSSASGRLAPGTRVALDLVTRCGECYYCKIGKSNLCENRFTPGQRMLGGFGEYIAVRPSQAYALPPALDFDAASFAEPLACCIHSLKRLKVAMTEDLLVVGAGAMGLLHLLAARCMGLRVTMSDPDRSRLEVARALGADFVVDPSSEDLAAFGREVTEGLGFSSCVVTSPAPSALEEAVGALAQCARINIYTSYEERRDLPLDANYVHRRELLVTGTEGRLEEDFFQAVRLLAFGKVDPRPLVSARTSFSTVAEGFERAMSGRAFRVLFEHGAP